MLRLFFNFDGHLLKVRKASATEVLRTPVCWKNRIEFEFIESTVLMMAWTSLLPDLEPQEAEALLNLSSARYPISFDYDELSRLCPKLVAGGNDQEWVFFGGSFNPWHEGHQACLSLLPQDKICFIAPDRSPHKDVDLDAVPLMINLSFKIKFGKKHFLVPTFMLDKKRNPTVDWVERLKLKWPERKISLLIGYDSLKNLKSWTRFEDLLPKLSTLYVASRLEQNSEHEPLVNELKKYNSNLMVTFLGHHDHEEASSTKLREIYGNGMKVE